MRCPSVYFWKMQWLFCTSVLSTFYRLLSRHFQYKCLFWFGTWLIRQCLFTVNQSFSTFRKLMSFWPLISAKWLLAHAHLENNNKILTPISVINCIKTALSNCSYSYLIVILLGSRPGAINQSWLNLKEGVWNATEEGERNPVS